MRVLIHKILAMFLLIALFPVLVVSVSLLKIESPKLPVFFLQQRVGINGNLFTMYKLRTMRPVSREEYERLLKENETGGILFKIKKDPRITKVGKWLRKMSIDEFPQLINVLKGEMALVGPRPALPSEVTQYNSNDSIRLRVLPGCTGLWQVSGRSNVSFEEMIQLDLEYIKKQNLSFDLSILARTFLIVLNMKGAY
ncbi:MAG: sugar transferase [Lactobacillus sp.]|nr:sugar transferase [Lactobacillus sp.]